MNHSSSKFQLWWSLVNLLERHQITKTKSNDSIEMKYMAKHSLFANPYVTD